MNYRIGVTTMGNKGIIPNSDLYRNNLTAATSIKVRDNFTVSSNINVNRSWANNRPSSNSGSKQPKKCDQKKSGNSKEQIF